jgi:rare lipoprotein A
LILGATFAVPCSDALAKSRDGVHKALRTGGGPVQSGRASWYGPGFHGRRTASGERFNTGAMTAAHRTLPFGTRVKVRNASTGRSVVVRINDRGPYAHGRIIDLSRASAQALGISGVGSVTLARL